MLDDLDLDALRKTPRISYYFRYPLHRRDFHELRVRNRLRGHYAAKPLYGRLTARGLVDRTAGYSGEVATLFVPTTAVSVDDVRVIRSQVDPHQLTSATGRRRWPAIRAAAEQSIRTMLAESRSPRRRASARSAEVAGRALARSRA